MDAQTFRSILWHARTGLMKAAAEKSHRIRMYELGITTEFPQTDIHLQGSSIRTMAYAERIARAKREYESDLGWLERDRTALNELEIIIEKFNAAEDEDWMAGVRDYFRARDDGKGRDPMPKKTKKV